MLLKLELHSNYSLQAIALMLLQLLLGDQTKHLKLWEVHFQIHYMSLLSSNAYTRRLQHVIGCGLPVPWSGTPCKTPQEKTKREKSQSLGFLQKKKKPSINESIQSKVRSLEKLPAIVLSEGRMMKPTGAEK